MTGLPVRLPGQLGPQHLEVVGDAQLDFVRSPGLAALYGLLVFLRRGGLALSRHGESQLPKDIIRLPRRLAAAELLRPKDPAEQRPAGQTDDCLGRVSSTLMDQLVARRRPEGVLHPG